MKEVYIMANNKIECNIILAIDISQSYYINFVVMDSDNNILLLVYETKFGDDYYSIRQKVVLQISQLLNNYAIDTILIEQNKLLTDTMSIYPDTYILRNIQLNYGIVVSIEDSFYDTIPYIIEVPAQEWTKSLFNSHSLYTIDRYKSYINLDVFTQEQKDLIDSKNFYKALCLCDCFKYQALLRKYWINKKENK